MTQSEALALEADFGIRFPPAYRNAITDGYPFRGPTEELDVDAVSLRQSNGGCRAKAPWGFPWQLHYWCIGGDGAGGFYFIDTRQGDSTIYYCDHEDMPSSIDDLDHIYITTFEEFIVEVQVLEKDSLAYDAEMRDKVANRKWWQIWVPRRWPPTPKS